MRRAATHVWIVDHDPGARWTLESALTGQGMLVRAFETAETVIAALQSDKPDALITEMQLPALSGLELLKFVRGTYLGVPVIVTSESADLKSAVSAYSGGAFEYLPKPLDAQEAGALVVRAAGAYSQVLRNVEVNAQVPEILGQSPAMQQVFRAIGRLACSSVTVLITGEPGTGKELTARALHYNSPRAGGPFITVSVGSITTDLLESELFGHEGPAFAGATTLAHRPGRFEQADGGTLFLDEIGDLSMAMQAQLLRVLMEGEFYRSGGRTAQRADVRVIAATRHDLEKRVHLRLFRADLYYRLNVMRIDVPPLRMRAEDVQELLVHCSSRVAHELGVEPKRFTPEALNKLADYEWPGNVRELLNLCRRVCVLAPSSEVRVEDLPPEVFSTDLPGWDAEWKDALAHWADLKAAGTSALMDEARPQFERVLMRVALEHTRGHKQDAARLLGWGRNTLARKMRALGVRELESLR